MEGGGEIAQEGLGGGVGGHTLYAIVRSHGTHVEHVALTARLHGLAEIIRQHGWREDVEIENEGIEGGRIGEEVAVVIHACIVDQHLHFQLLLFAPEVEALGGILHAEVDDERTDVNVGETPAKLCGFVMDGILVAHDNQLIATSRHCHGILVTDTRTGARHQGVGSVHDFLREIDVSIYV